jgi:Cytochrome c
VNKAYVALFVVAVAAACNQPPRDAGSQAVTVTLPVGDVQAGRKAFVDLKCTACHAVPSESEFPAPVSANPGPPIDARVGGRDVSYLATAIVSPSHELSSGLDEAVRAQLAGVLSPMGDFSHTMTVRQLVDLQTYLRSVK